MPRVCTVRAPPIVASPTTTRERRSTERTLDMDPQLTLEERHRAQEAELKLRQAEDRRRANEEAETRRDAALAAAQAAQAAERAAEAERELDATLRRNFFAANASATEERFAELLPRLREDHLVRMAATDPVAEEAQALAASMPPGFTGRF